MIQFAVDYLQVEHIMVVGHYGCGGVLATLRGHPQGRDAALIGHVTRDPDHFVQMTTALGGRRVVDWLTGDQLPRIC